MTKRRVVVTGIGMLTPLGNDTESTWKAALAGKSGIGPITQYDAEAFASRIAGEVKGFDPATVVDPKEVKKMDLFCLYSIAAAVEAWGDSSLADLGGDTARMGCIFGVGLGGLGILEKFHESYLKSGPRRISPFLIPGLISNLSAGHIAIRLGLNGVNFVISSACASSTHAIGEAARMISAGIQDVVLTGGAESTVTPMGVGGFCSMKALSTRNDEPEKASRPFDKGRDGFVLSEGSVALVLEEYEHAKSRGAKIYGEILGYGTSCDADHITAPAADGSGAAACMSGALTDAGVNPEEVQYVNAHGTSTPLGDVAETVAIKKVFGDHAKSNLLVSSTKSMTGHLLGAAGAIEAAFSLKGICEGVVLPTINLDDPDEQCDLDYVPHEPREKEVKIAVSNSFGFGGTNASLVIGAV